MSVNSLVIRAQKQGNDGIEPHTDHLDFCQVIYHRHNIITLVKQLHHMISAVQLHRGMSMSLLAGNNLFETDIDRLFTEQVRRDTEALAETPYAGRVGAFEGASYEPTGLYRPEVDCIMFTRNPVGFCRVCQRAIGNVIDLYARP